MQSSKIGYRKWALAIYIFTTGINGWSGRSREKIAATLTGGVADG